MNTKLYKYVIAFVLAFTALPMMAQDYMNIYLKNGDFRKFYMKNIVEIVATKVDADGVEHDNYAYQRITTIYDNYVYKLEDVDSITFTKIDEELAEQNFVSAMPEVFSAIEDCETINDVESLLSEIQHIDGVENAWSDGNQLYIKIDKSETYSFIFDQYADLSGNFESFQIKNYLARMKETVKPNESTMTAVVINQQHKDEDRSQKVSGCNDLLTAFRACGIEADYVDEPTVDFFYNNSTNQENKHIYDYDIIMLSTHGYYGQQLYYRSGNDYAEGIKCHGIVTAEDIKDIKIKAKLQDKDDSDLPSEEKWKKFYKDFSDWRENTSYSDVSESHITFGFVKELRNNTWYWVGHPILTEFFFRDVAKGTFKNPNSIMFNDACESLKGDNRNTSYRFANILFGRGLGSYLGYTETNCTGFWAGVYFYLNMLAGMSIEQSRRSLDSWFKEETVATFQEGEIDKIPYGAQLLILPEEKEKDSFLSPVHTVSTNHETAMSQYNNDGSVEIAGTTSYVFVNGITTLVPSGFCYGLDSNNLSNSIASEKINKIEDGNIQFTANITGLEPGQTCFYRAYTYDDLYYNYGETCSFKVPFNLQIESNSLELENGDSKTIKITSGNGDYTVDNSDEGVVTASVDGETVVITAIGAGPATITVTDILTGQSATIQVTVTATTQEGDLALSLNNLITVNVDEGRTIVITSGSGNFAVESSREAVATVSVRGKYVTINGKYQGRATITVTDRESGQTASVKVKVKKPDNSDVVSLINNGDMEGTDVSSFFARTGTWELDYSPADIIDGIGVDGSRGIEVDATDKVSEMWDNQFWIRFDQPISAGTNYRLSFDYRADKNASSIRTETHAEPGDWIDWAYDYMSFTTGWQTYTRDTYVYSDESLDSKPFQSIAFDLSGYSYANNYYFDNVKFEVYLDGQCPKPAIIVDENVISLNSPFNAKIYYTLDGSTPTTSSSVYNSSIILNESCTVKAIAVVDGYDTSPIATYTYTK